MAFGNWEEVAIKSALAIGGLSLCLAFIHYPDVTSDKLLTAVFGGFFIGAELDWQFAAARYWTEQNRCPAGQQSSNPAPRGRVILIPQHLYFRRGSFFLGIEIALYSILTYFAASKTIDFLLMAIEDTQRSPSFLNVAKH